MKNYDLEGMFYYNGFGNKLLDRLKFQYGIIICRKYNSYNVPEETFMYYDPVKRKDVYKPTQNRKSIELTYYYYNDDDKNLQSINIDDNIRYSETFIKNNFIRASRIEKDLDTLSRQIKLSKIIKKIKNNQQRK